MGMDLIEQIEIITEIFADNFKSWPDDFLNKHFASFQGIGLQMAFSH